MKILIISGKQGSGKTTLQKAMTEYWYRRHQRGASCLNFADPIKEMHDAVLNVLHKNWPDRGLVKDGPLLQLLGTEWGRRTIDDGIWIKIMKERLSKVAETNRLAKIHENSLVIIGDCRFLNEFEAFPEALRVRLECPENIRRGRAEMWREHTNHASEIGLDDVASHGEFDILLNTSKTDVAGCVSLLTVALEKGDWVGRR